MSSLILNSLSKNFSSLQKRETYKNKPINNTRFETIANSKIYIIHRASPHEATRFPITQSTDSKSSHPWISMSAN